MKWPKKFRNKIKKQLEDIAKIKRECLAPYDEIIKELRTLQRAEFEKIMTKKLRRKE